jgi:hypothetical protein
VLTCRIPVRLAAKTAAFEVGDKVRMICVRQRGRRAELRKLVRLGDKAEKAREKAAEKKAEEKKAGEKRGDKQTASGLLAELAPGVIVVQGDSGRLACRVPAEKQAKLAGLELGAKVTIYCLDGVLVGIERGSAGEERKLYGRITALSRTAVTVEGEAGALTCAPPAGMAEKLVGRFAVGDSVKMMCRGSELTYLEHV